MGRLEVSRASAGTGKTYSICEAIVDRVREGLDPARILATTFTVKAAAELKGRIQTRILEETSLPVATRVERAERLELACLGTVDSVAKQLLERFALELGLPPKVQVIEEESSERYLRQLLRVLSPDRWSAFLTCAERLALVDDRRRAREGSQILLALLRVRRENGIDAAQFTADLQRSADELCTLLSPHGPDPTLTGLDVLQRLAREALRQLPQPKDKTNDTRKSIATLRGILSRSAVPWASFAAAARIKAGAKSNDQLDPIRDYATHHLRRQPGLQADVREFLALASELTLALDEQYTAFKRERGVYDFTDLEVYVDQLLRDEELGERLAAEFDFVVIDEFQDTSPLQLAIFTQLRERVRESYWVGDEKQAIYGFRGADARLMRSVWEAAENAAATEGGLVRTRSLSTNYRSREGLVEFVNATFAPVLGESVVVGANRRLQADDPPTAAGTVERWAMQYKGRENLDPKCIATGVQTWIEEGTAPGSIAVLGRTNKAVYAIADQLTKRGVPTVVERPGLVTQRECRLALSALRVVDDPREGVAAATVLHLLGDAESTKSVEDGGDSPTGEATTPVWFEKRLQVMHAVKPEEHAPTPFEGHALLKPLRELSARRTIASPSEMVIAVIAALNLGTRVARWGNAAIRSSHLDALVGHAHTYESEAAVAGRPATVNGLIGYFETLGENEEDILPAVGGVDAVTLGTYHSAKGLEWDHVVLTELDHDRATNFWNPEAEGETNPNDPLEQRVLSYWPWPFGSAFGKVLRGSELEVDALASERGQRMNAEDVDESVRLLYVGMTRARERVALVTKEGKEAAWLDRVPEIDRLLPEKPSEKLPEESAQQQDDEASSVANDRLVLPARVRGDGSTPAPPLVRRRVVTPAPLGVATAPSVHWIDATPRPNADRVTAPAYHSPSGLKMERNAAAGTSGIEASEAAPEAKPTFTFVKIPGTPLPVERVDASMADRRGNALHQYFGALPSLGSSDATTCESVARSVLDHWGFPEANAHAVVEAGRRFRAWVEEVTPDAQWLSEVPVTAPRNGDAGQSDGARQDGAGQWNGFVDLLLLRPDGTALLVDHKSGMVHESGWGAYASQYVAQLEAYRSILERAGHPVDECWLHLPLSGAMIRVG